MIYRTDKQVKNEYGKAKNPHTEIDNRAIDSDLSFEALGMLTRLLRNKDDWNYSVKGISERIGVGRDKVTKLINELKRKGYIISCEQNRNINDKSKKRGTFGKIEYTILEFPDDFDFDDDKPFCGY